MTRQVRVDVRWSCPAHPAGVISTYEVATTTSLKGDAAWNISALTDRQLDSKFSVVDAPISTVLHFKVAEISLFLRQIITHQFNGPGKTVSQFVCVCVCGR